jgi:Family of unknown function (DUF5996)
MVVTEVWPALPFEEWKDTYATLHRWCQIVGKIRLALMPWINHSWHVTLYVSPRGLTTGPMPAGAKSLQIDFDFIAHELRISTSENESRSFPLVPNSVAGFYRKVMAALGAIGVNVRIHTKPNELEDATPLDKDEQHASYDRDAAYRFWRILVQTERVFTRFRARFRGKSSPVHFFWGSFDLAVTRFSGRTAPRHPGGVPNLPDWVAREAYSHEVSSAGFWPGGGAIDYPAFYSYAYPTPEGFKEAPIGPAVATYNSQLREFILPYDEVRQAEDPDAVLLDFLQSTYEAAANAGKWDRKALECLPDPRLS